MKFDDETIEYLKGEKFSSGITVSISKMKSELISRKEYIIQNTRNKKIIHLGCCDHKPLIRDKILNDTWLHKHLTENTKYCLGVDIDKDAVEYVKSEFKYNNVIYGDITDKNKIKEIEDSNFDFIVMGEILEHVDNPTDFLNRIKQNYSKSIKRVLITVPNAFARSNFINAKKNIESINSDHRFWFTPYTLAKIGTAAGYIIEDYFFTQDISKKIGLSAKIKILPYIKRKILINDLTKNPFSRETLVMIMAL